ncbi:efflux RND transporter permease subunit [Paenibacillus sp.]|uniref:efflux RND transporter permease subunit n=1 Tax=Paenibacillus sp. TaxID=58172 RepID=UPI002D309F98|nr:efflux RND transporter permease subunit [Paenibacillus sp.]HZG85643.1 efflux RND transporter permease subunit [Paenibacillus sp.]
MMTKMLKRPAIVLLLSVMTAAFGAIAMLTLPIKLQPSVSAPYITAMAVVDKELSLDEMEKQIALPLETAVVHNAFVKDVNVTTTTSTVMVDVVLKDSATEEDIAQAKDDLTQAMNSLNVELDVSDVRQYSTADQMVMMIAVTSDAPDQEKVRSELRDIVVPELRKLPGVSKVEHSLNWYDVSYVFELKPEKMSSLQQTARVVDEIRGAFSQPLLGNLEYDGGQYRVRSEALIGGQAELASYRLSSGSMLADLADVREDRPADHNYAMRNGQPYYEISIFATEDASEVKVSERVRAKLAALNDGAATSWSYVFPWDASAFIGSAVKELALNIAIGALVAAAVLYAVFRSIRIMMVIGFSIPLCMFATFIGMSAFGYSINIITLMGIGLGTGMVVDACIVVIENIFRKMGEGLPRQEAVVQGTKEVIAPVISSIVTTICVFVPIGMLDGMIGEFMKQLALTITVSLLASLVVAATLIPILTSRWVQPPKESNKRNRVLEGYERMLRFGLRFRWGTLLTFVAVLAVSLYALIAFVPKNYIPNVSDRSLYIEYEVDRNIDYATARGLAETAAARIADVDGVMDVFYWGNDRETHRGTLIILYDPRDTMTRSDEAVNEDIEAVIERTIPYTLLSIGQGQGDMSGRMEVSVTAASMKSLSEEADAIAESLRLLPGVTGVQAPLSDEGKEWVIRFSPDRLEYHNITRGEVEQYISLVLNGVDDIELTMDGDTATARVEFPTVYRQTSDALYKLPLRSDSSLTVEDVADLALVDAESSRVRKDGIYESTLTVYYDEADKASVVERVTAFVSEYRSAEAQVAIAGTQQEQNEAFSKLLVAVGVAFSAVFLVLVMQFNRLRQPLLIMLSLPFAMIGVALGFLLSGRVFDIMAMIGIVMLVGIVVNNAIVLIDFINKSRDAHPDIESAVIAGCKLRMKPILTTTLTTAGGLVPMFIGGTETSDFQTPIATAVIFGLLFSMFVSLYLVPVLYLMIDGRAAGKARKPLFGWFGRKPAASEAAPS